MKQLLLILLIVGGAGLMWFARRSVNPAGRPASSPAPVTPSQDDDKGLIDKAADTITETANEVIDTVKEMFTPRGVKANNLLNIESNSHNNWLGKVTPSVDRRFETFQAPEYGFRAGAILLRDTYQGRYGLESVSELIHKFAPSHENDSDGYAQFVAGQLGVGIHDPVNLRSDAILAKMLHAMSIMEVGRQYSLETAQRGVQMA